MKKFHQIPVEFSRFCQKTFELFENPKIARSRDKPSNYLSSKKCGQKVLAASSAVYSNASSFKPDEAAEILWQRTFKVLMKLPLFADLSKFKLN